VELRFVKVNALALFASWRFVFVSAQCKKTQVNSANTAVSTAKLLGQKPGSRDHESGNRRDGRRLIRDPDTVA
jgi:hypothetical protein